MTNETTVKAQVICAGASYKTREQSIDANGNPVLGPDGKTPLEYDTTRTAPFRSIIEVTQAEYDRLAGHGCVRPAEDAGKPIPVANGTRATPFGAPMAGEPAWAGPVMGDPNPAQEGVDANRGVGGLTAEEAAALERRASGQADAEAAAENYSKDQLSELALENEVSSSGTKAEIAQRLLDAGVELDVGEEDLDDEDEDEGAEG